MTLRPVALLYALSICATPISSLAGSDGNLRALNANQDGSCSFYDFEGYWEGIDPETGEVEYVQFDCEIDEGYCTVTEFEAISDDCDGGKSIATGKIYKKDFDDCETPDFKLDVKCFTPCDYNPDPEDHFISPFDCQPHGQQIYFPLNGGKMRLDEKSNKYSQSRRTKRIKDKKNKKKNKNGGGRK